MVRMRQLASEYKLPVWMTEYSTHELQGLGVCVRVGGAHACPAHGRRRDAIDYMWGYFGSWVRSDTHVSIDFNDGVYRELLGDTRFTG